METTSDLHFMKTQILTLTAIIASLSQASAAPDFIEFHERMVDNLKAVRDTFVPAPLVQFVEGFPPIAIPRQKILHLAQADAPPPGSAVDPAAISEWANDVAAITTQRTLDGLFGRSTPRRPVIVGGERDAKAVSTMEEDLNVMMRILEKAAGGKDEEKPRAMGIDVFSFGRGGAAPRVFYIDGYGAMFVLNVKYPLIAPPAKADQGPTNEPTSSEWDKAREEVYGRRNTFNELRLNAAPAEEFDSQRVEDLKQQIIDDLANATHMKGLKSDDYVTVVVLGGGSRGSVSKREVHGTPRGGRGFGGGGSGGRGEFHAAVEVNAASGEAAPAQSTMTIRAKKLDIDAFAKGKLKPEEFRKKISVQVH
jgi:hypothetical protein